MTKARARDAQNYPRGDRSERRHQNVTYLTFLRLFSQ
jgi:hypothetical protein